jgi:hypothetical protein
MPTLEQLKDLQGTEHKGIVRTHVGNQMISYCKQVGEPLSLVSLPAEWPLEKWLIPNCENSGVVIRKIVGVEKSNEFSEMVEKSKPIHPAITFVKGDIIKVMKSSNDCNIFYPDLCIGPANSVNWDRYEYPELKAIVEKMADMIKNNQKGMIFGTFQCNGRLANGKLSLAQAMGGTNCSSVARGIVSKICQMLSAKGLTDKAVQTMMIEYKGGQKSHMLTFGYAVNFVPNFPKIKQNLWKVRNENNIPSIPLSSVIKVDSLIKLKQQAIRDLSDKGWTNEKIALTLSLTRNQVGAIMAHKNHPESFRK